MSRSTGWRIGGFVAALAASAALVASAASSTGAWFTDVTDGSLSASSGHLNLVVSGDKTINFANLMPGETRTADLGYTADVSGGTVDVWLVFPTDTPQQATAYCLFTGPKDQCGGGGLGRYGYFAVSADGYGQAFRSHNLKNAPAGVTGQSCGVDGNGRGGSDQQATSVLDTPPYCGVPTAILVADNVADGASGTLHVSFGLSGRQDQQGQVEPTVPFQIVATQSGHRPDAENF